MVVHDLDLDRAGAARGPFEADSPLIVDPDAPLASSVAFQSFQTVAGASQIANVDRCIELIQFAERASFEPRERGDPAAQIEGFRPFVPKANDQCFIKSAIRVTSSINHPS